MTVTMHRFPVSPPRFRSPLSSPCRPAPPPPSDSCSSGHRIAFLYFSDQERTFLSRLRPLITLPRPRTTSHRFRRQPHAQDLLGGKRKPGGGGVLAGWGKGADHRTEEVGQLDKRDEHDSATEARVAFDDIAREPAAHKLVSAHQLTASPPQSCLPPWCFTSPQRRKQLHFGVPLHCWASCLILGPSCAGAGGAG